MTNDEQTNVKLVGGVDDICWTRDLTMVIRTSFKFKSGCDLGNVVKMYDFKCFTHYYHINRTQLK